MARMALAGAAVLTLLLAGCAGTATSSSAAGPPSGTAADPTVSDDTGSITGTVVSEELAPIVGARVGIPSLAEATAIADATGTFTLNHIPPGTYSVFAEQLGYDAKAQKVTVAAGEVASVRFVLEAIATPGDARQLHYQIDGFVELAVVVPSVGVFYFNNTGETLNVVYYKVAPDVASTVFGLTWSSTVPLTGRYSRINAFLCKGTASCTEQNFTRGFSPTVIRMDELQDSVEGRSGYQVAAQWYPTTCQATSVELCVANPDTITAVTFQQRYKLYTSVFYVDSAPLGYDPTPP